MINPVKQHYVPRAYLKAFGDSKGNLYQLTRKYLRIKRTNISAICYQHDYFTIKREETKLLNKVSDPYHIEKKAFTEQENRYEGILQKFTEPSLTEINISKADVRFFLEILVTIKRRNPVIRNVLMNSYKEYFNAIDIERDFAHIIELARKIDKIDPVEYFEKYKLDLNSNSAKLDDMYLLSFLPNNDKKVMNQVLDTLMSRRFMINHAPIGYQFITSDNPGFTVVGDKIVDRGGLNESFCYFFPLTPLCCLMIDGELLDGSNIQYKTIYSNQVSPSAVAITNLSTAFLANEKLLSRGEEVLKKFRQQNAQF